MKRFAAFALLLVYFTVTTGFVVSVHRCMNKVVSVDLGYSAPTECGKCGMDMRGEDGCCQDEVTLVKMKADHQAAKALAFDALCSLPPAAFPTEALLFPPVSAAVAQPSAHGPPPLPLDRCVLHCVFRL